MTSPGDPLSTTASSSSNKAADLPSTPTAYPKGTFSIRPYLQAYFRRYGEKVNRVLCGRLSRVLAPLEQEYDAAQVLGRFKRYLDRTAPEFFSPWQFAQTWAAWIPPADGPVFTPYHPVSKFVAVEDGKRSRLERVPIDDPRPAA